MHRDFQGRFQKILLEGVAISMQANSPEAKVTTN